MAQNFLDRLDESVGMEEYDINKGIANAAMQRGISPVEMRAQVLKQNLQAIGRTISDDDLRLFALGEITLSDVMGRTLSDQDLGGRTISDSDYITFPGGRQIRTQEKLTRDIIDSIKGKMGKKFQQWGRTLSDSDTDQIQALAADSGRTVSDRSKALIEQIKNLESVLAESGKNISDRDRHFLEMEIGDLDTQLRTTLSLNDYFELQDKQRIKAIQEGRTISDEDLATGRIFSDRDLGGGGRTMSDQNFATEQSSQDFQRHLQGILMESGATISDRDRQFVLDLIGDFVDPRTLSDRDRQILNDIQGRTPSDSDAAILEMLK